MNKIIIGQCSICGGNVSIPEIWHGVNPPVPTCENCGAVKKRNLPIIPMSPLPYPKDFSRRKRNPHWPSPDDVMCWRKNY